MEEYRLETHSVIRTDLSRLPDVQQLISSNMSKLEKLHSAILMHLPLSTLASLARDRLASLPDFHQV